MFKITTKKLTIGVFLFYLIVILAVGTIYAKLLIPSEVVVRKIITKFSTNDYSIPYFVAERYLTWYSMRTFFISLNYLLTLLGNIATLVTVFYASNYKVKKDSDNKSESNNENNNGSVIIFLTLLSLSFSFGVFFINPSVKGNMSQHIWREMDICIMQTINNRELTSNEKDKVLIDKIAELERYVETFEN